MKGKTKTKGKITNRKSPPVARGMRPKQKIEMDTPAEKARRKWSQNLRIID